MKFDRWVNVLGKLGGCQEIDLFLEHVNFTLATRIKGSSRSPENFIKISAGIDALDAMTGTFDELVQRWNGTRQVASDTEDVSMVAFQLLKARAWSNIPGRFFISVPLKDQSHSTPWSLDKEKVGKWLSKAKERTWRRQVLNNMNY